MNILVHVFLLVIGLAAAPLAPALSLGGITGNGAVGERLDAWVPLYLATGERHAIKGAALLPDVFAQRAAFDPALDDIRATVVHLANGSFVHLQSTTPVNVERLQFRLRVETARGAVVGRYQVRLTNARIAPVTPNIVARQRRTRAVANVKPEAIRSNDNAYGPVRSGESLWTIARQLAQGNDVQRMMNDLHALNPSAFIGGNADRLRAGVMLALPASATLTAAAAPLTDNVVDVMADVSESTTANDDVRAAPDTDGEASVQAANELDGLLAEVDTGQVTPPVATTAAAATSSRDAARVAKLAALDAKFAAIRAKYGANEQTSTQTSTNLRTVDAAMTVAPTAATEVPRAAPAPASGDAPAVTAPVAAGVTQRPLTKPVKFESTPTPALADGGVVATWAGYGVATLLGIALGIWTFRRLGRLMASRRTRASDETGRVADAGRKAEVTRKAENRIRMESEIRGLLDRKGKGGPEAAAVSLADTVEPPPVSALEQTLDVLPAASLTGSAERDREVAIDANIAHGRYAEAEALLREVIGSHARNFQAKLRLAEVYYITEQIERFADVATDLKDHHRPDLTDEEWQRVVRMGKIIAPDLVLFSGPKAVGKRA